VAQNESKYLVVHFKTLTQYSPRKNSFSQKANNMPEIETTNYFLPVRIKTFLHPFLIIGLRTGWKPDNIFRPRNWKEYSITGQEPNRVGISFPSPEDGNRSNLQSALFSTYLEFQMMDKVEIRSDSEKQGRSEALKLSL
jgi:hypothetical protein